MTHVTIYSDGAARGNPNGPGGYGSIIQFVDSKGQMYEKELSEGFNPTSNNRMELLGAIVALEHLTKPCTVDLYSDSSYLVNAFLKNWIGGWQQHGWKNASKDRVKNQDLWKRLLVAMEPHQVQFHWVKGHNGHPENERCDTLATTAADKMTGMSRPNVEIINEH